MYRWGHSCAGRVRGNLIGSHHKQVGVTDVRVTGVWTGPVVF